MSYHAGSDALVQAAAGHRQQRYTGPQCVGRSAVRVVCRRVKKQITELQPISTA